MAYIDEAGLISLTAQIKNKVDNKYLEDILDLLYPIGTIYMSINNTSPSSLFGGIWVQIKDMFLLSAGDTYTAGDTGGKANYIADDMPMHTHDKGTMEIAGIVGPLDDSSKNNLSGAFYNAGAVAYDASSTGSGNGWKLGLKASDGWTGETSQSGTNTQATILPPYLVVYMWQRVA